MEGSHTFIVTSWTETFYSQTPNKKDALPWSYLKIPDEGTMLVEVSLNLKRRVVRRMVYVTVHPEVRSTRP